MFKPIPSNILSLATETFHDIGTKLDHKDVQSLRATCKRLDDTLKPLALSRLILNMNRANLDFTIEQLAAYATNTTSAAPYVRTLDLRCFAPSRDPNSTQAAIITNGDGTWSYVFPTREPCPEIIMAEKRLHEYLPILLPQLTNVRRVRWTLSAPDLQWTYSLIVDYILNLPHLEDFSALFIHGLLNSLPFTMIPRLRRLTVSGIYMANCKKSIIQFLTDTVANSPELREVELHSGFYSADDDSDAPTLHQLFENIPQDRTSNIQRLSLTCWRTLLDPQTIPHLHHLKSLQIDHNLHTVNFGSSMLDIWSSLRRERIHLEEIRLNLVDVENGLIDYLASYSGLKQLLLTNFECRWSDPKDVKQIAKQFFAIALYPHVESLEILKLYPYTENDWCVDSNNAPAILQCKWLKELHIAIRSRSQTKPVISVRVCLYSSASQISKDSYDSNSLRKYPKDWCIWNDYPSAALMARQTMI
ncbi:hypothetical protein BDQ17DRAFT_1312394 [Cyathus striatus]|nr:hypothetical protein BDQ17DRAFT_1312394 [Cyathus striatus]